MSAIGSLVSFTAGSKIVSADVNANFAAIRSAFNTSAVLTDTVATITVTHTFATGFTISAGKIGGSITFTSAITVSSGGITVASGGVLLPTGDLQLTAGTVGVGVAPVSYVGCEVGRLLSGSQFQTGIDSLCQFDSSATSEGMGMRTRVATVAQAFTMVTGYGIRVLDASKGAGSSITTLYGVYVADQTQGGTNIAIKTNAGLVQFGGNVTCAAALNVAGTMTVSTALSAPTLVVTTAGTVGAVALGINNDTTSGFYIASGGVQVAASGTNVSDMRASLWQAAVKARAVAGFIVGNGATLATSATVGYLYVPTMPGTATGVPTIGAVETGTVALAFDTTNNRLQIYNSGWKTVLLA